MDLVSSPGEGPQERIFSLLFEEDELTWQNIIYELVKTEEMNPWDIDVSLIAHKFIEMLKKLKEMDFRISGKVVLASAILLKLKSNRLLEEDINAFDSLISSMDDPADLLDELPLEYPHEIEDKEKDKPRLMPRTPQPRKRKVSVYDLIQALEKALEVEVRRPVYVEPSIRLKAPEKVIDITEVIKDVYQKVETHYEDNGDVKAQKLTFSQLIPSDSKEDKVFTFIPLLHLENQQMVGMKQKIHFGEIYINLLQNSGIDISKIGKPEAE
ncbi:segregation/condensation protein A [Candidatus Woesearchaeota archaeon]|nr:segregation/condensation protein A [Candidatus Woesearchaeota archaeon]